MTKEIEALKAALNKRQYFPELKVPDYAIHNSKEIRGFFGQYRFLSNFYKCINGIWYEGDKFPSVEHAYQAAKVEKIDRAPFQCCSAAEVKKLGGVCKVNKDEWEQVKYSVMVQLVTQKFATHDDLRNKLIKTGKAFLEETNIWDDVYWGVCNGIGQNKLGKILMTVRNFWYE